MRTERRLLDFSPLGCMDFPKFFPGPLGLRWFKRTKFGAPVGSISGAHGMTRPTLRFTANSLRVEQSFGFIASSLRRRTHASTRAFAASLLSLLFETEGAGKR